MLRLSVDDRQPKRRQDEAASVWRGKPIRRVSSATFRGTAASLLGQGTSAKT